MRKPFRISVRGNKNLYWRELSFSDALPLRDCFNAILDKHQVRVAKEDGQEWEKLSREEKSALRKRVADTLFGLRDYPLGMHQILPLAAVLGLPALLRLRQTPADVKTGVLGQFHFGVLHNITSNTIVGVTTFERTKAVDAEGNRKEAEIAYYKHPNLRTSAFTNAVYRLMVWGKVNCGITDYLAHIEAPTNTHRGNPASEAFAKGLGLEFDGIRAADDPKGNGKKTLVYRAEGWAPLKIGS